MELIIILIQLVFTILLYLFTRYNYRKIDNWLVTIGSIVSLIPIIGGTIIFSVWIAIFFVMAEERELPNTKINKFLFRSKFKNKN